MGSLTITEIFGFIGLIFKLLWARRFSISAVAAVSSSADSTDKKFFTQSYSCESLKVCCFNVIVPVNCLLQT